LEHRLALEAKTLRPSVVIEPLIDDWYAWSYLVSPITSALLFENSHLPIMRSFCEAPEIHFKASTSRRLRGGPYLGLDPSLAPLVEDRISKAERKFARTREVARDIGAVWRMLCERADGSSLEPFYAKIPASLKGRTELVYDACGRASPRFVEMLFWAEEELRHNAQSLRLAASGAQRGFAFNTPRIGDDELRLQLRFEDRRLDRLAMSRTCPVVPDELADLLELAPEERPAFRALFETPPPPQARQDQAEMSIRYVNHACVLIETAEASILVDPLIGHPDAAAQAASFASIPDKLDYILLTHNHQDHVVLETLLQCRHRRPTIVHPRNLQGSVVDPSLSLVMRSLGYRDIVAIDELGVVEIPNGGIIGIPFFGEHGDLSITTKLGYVIELNGRRIVFMADSNNLDNGLYERIAEFAGNADILFLGMECDGAPVSWLYGGLLAQPLTRAHDQSRRLNGSDSGKARALCRTLKPKHVVIYAMGQEPWLGHLMATDYDADSRPLREASDFVAALRAEGQCVSFPHGPARWLI
jgi:L-ascorbate metabolism protein UlaG (beta-lactamase superfamily)